MKDDLKDGEVIVQVITNCDEEFRAISSKTLLEIAARRGTGDYDQKEIDQMRKDFFKASRPCWVQRTSQCYCNLVLDGSLEAESWLELIDGSEEDDLPIEN